jgi:hypothetical protein
MNANWVTSLTSGVLFGVVVSVIQPAAGWLSLSFVLLLFVLSSVFGFIGVRQMKEAREKGRIGFTLFLNPVERDHFLRWYLAAWGRMFTWCMVSAASAVITQTLMTR